MEIDDERLLGTMSQRLKEKAALKSENDRLHYELDRVSRENEQNTFLLRSIRQKIFWQNNMEIVQMIDERIKNV